MALQNHGDWSATSYVAMDWGWAGIAFVGTPRLVGCRETTSTCLNGRSPGGGSFRDMDQTRKGDLGLCDARELKQGPHSRRIRGVPICRRHLISAHSKGWPQGRTNSRWDRGGGRIGDSGSPLAGPRNTHK